MDPVVSLLKLVQQTEDQNYYDPLSELGPGVNWH